MNDVEKYNYVKYILEHNPVNLRMVKYYSGELPFSEIAIRKVLHGIEPEIWVKAFNDVKDNIYIEVWNGANYYTDMITYQEYLDRKSMRYVFENEWKVVDSTHPLFERGLTQLDYHEIDCDYARNEFFKEVKI